jgi:hypothetical protein
MDVSRDTNVIWHKSQNEDKKKPQETKQMSNTDPTKINLENFFLQKINKLSCSLYSRPHLIRSLTPKAIPLIRSDFRCNEIV